MTCAFRQLGLPEIVLLFGLSAGVCSAQAPPLPTAAHDRTITCLADLKRLSLPELEEIYRCAEPGTQPVGFLRGEMLHLPDRRARLKLCMMAMVWKGKHFTEEGDFINQFTGFRAVRSHAYIGPSHLDGRPSLILEYPGRTSYFGKIRDEAREIAPGLYIAMVYARCEPHDFMGCLGLELAPVAHPFGGRSAPCGR